MNPYLITKILDKASAAKFLSEEVKTEMAVLQNIFFFGRGPKLTFCHNCQWQVY